MYLLLCKSSHAARHLDSTLGQRYEPNFKRQSRQRHTRLISPLTGPAPSIWLKPYFDLLCCISSWLFSVEIKEWRVGRGDRERHGSSLAQSQKNCFSKCLKYILHSDRTRAQVSLLLNKMTEMSGNTWDMSKYTVGKYIFQASAVNGISHKLNYLTEVEHVLQFIIAPPPKGWHRNLLQLLARVLHIQPFTLCPCTSTIVMFCLRSSVHFAVGVNMVDNKASQSWESWAWSSVQRKLY